ncbi:MAG: hypothetical protein WBV82_05505, partial [Myxococcaceae bacterium]
PQWSVNPGSIRVQDPTSGYTLEYTWSAPQPRVGAQGFKLTMKVTATAPRTGSVTAGIEARSNVFTFDKPAPVSAQVTVENGRTDSATVEANVVPPTNYSGTGFLWVGASYGPGVTYNYRAQYPGAS